MADHQEMVKACCRYCGAMAVLALGTSPTEDRDHLLCSRCSQFTLAVTHYLRRTGYLHRHGWRSRIEIVRKSA